MMTPNKKKNQIRRTIEALEVQPMTSMMLSARTGILRANLTRYIAYLEKRNKVVTVEEKPCKITGHKAKYYSSDPKYFHPEVQSELFKPERPLV